MDELRARIRETLRRVGLAQLPPGVLAAALAIAVVGIVLGLRQWWPRAEAVSVTSHTEASASDASPASTKSQLAGTNAPSATGSSTPAQGEAQAADGGAATIYVDVVGAVRRPGLYQLPTGSRVADVVEQAGGLLGNAAERAVNLARPLADGEQVVVPTQDEYASDPAAGQQAAGTSAGSVGGGSTTAASSIQRVNVNTADAALLDTLPGVGPSTAQKIIDEREANGPFASVDDLSRVPGIGPKKLEALRDVVATQ